MWEDDHSPRPAISKNTDPIQKNKESTKGWDVAQLIEYLASKALSSNTSTTKK
jgi:hypothetical protein